MRNKYRGDRGNTAAENRRWVKALDDIFWKILQMFNLY